MKSIKEEKFLPLNLQFFAEDGGDSTDAGDSQGQKDDQGSHTNDQQKSEPMIPKSRFDEVNNKFKEMQKQLDEFAKNKEKEETEAQKKRGEFEELYTKTSQELDGLKSASKTSSERVAQLETVIQGLVDAELTAIPEDMRDLIPESMTPEQKLTWISNAKSKGLFGSAKQENDKKDTPLGQSTNAGQQKTDTSKMSVSQMLRSAYGSKK